MRLRLVLYGSLALPVGLGVAGEASARHMLPLRTSMPECRPQHKPPESTGTSASLAP